MLCLEGRGETFDDAGSSNLTHCSVMSGAGSVTFEIRKGAAGAVNADSCLFSRPEVPGLESSGAVLIHQEDANDMVIYRGTGNRYHNLESYWSIGEETKDWTEYLAYLSNKNQNQDSSPSPLTESPWKQENPLRALANASIASVASGSRSKKDTDRTLDLAFEVNDQLASMRTGTGTAIHLIGVERLGSFSFLNGVRPLDQKPDGVARKVRIVDPSIKETGNGVYRTLEVAVKEAVPGDTIEIRHTGALACKPLDLEEANIDLTIQPAQGFRPYLTFGETTESDAALFVLHDARLKLSGLEFRLKPMREEFTVQSVVTLVGEGSCSLQDCIITLESGEGKTHLAAATVSILGPAKMKMDMRPSRIPGPIRLSFDNCVIRGDGDLVWDRAVRSFDLKINNTLAALAGSLLNVEVPRDSNPPPGLAVNVALTKVTTFLSGNLLRLNVGNDLKGLIPIHVAPTECFFAAANAGKSLIHLDGPETDPQKLKIEKLLDWQAGANSYVLASSPYFDQQPPGEAMSVKMPMDADSWKTFSGEERSLFDGKFTIAPPPDLKFAKVTPEVIKPQDSRYGADTSPLQKLFAQSE